MAGSGQHRRTGLAVGLRPHLVHHHHRHGRTGAPCEPPAAAERAAQEQKVYLGYIVDRDHSTACGGRVVVTVGLGRFWAEVRGHVPAKRCRGGRHGRWATWVLLGGGSALGPLRDGGASTAARHLPMERIARPSRRGNHAAGDDAVPPRRVRGAGSVRDGSKSLLFTVYAYRTPHSRLSSPPVQLPGNHDTKMRSLPIFQPLVTVYARR